MQKLDLFFFPILMIAAVACGGSVTTPAGSQLSTPEPATDSPPAQVNEPELPSTANPEVDPGTGMEDRVSTPPGLSVVYLREGNLWSWTEVGGSVQLTGTGDMSTACLSTGGQLLAFLRGREVWTVRMDGSDASLLATLPEPGGALWFAPNDLLLAVSTSDRIDLIDLSTSAMNTVITYPAIPGNYFPEVIWSLDSTGFKTVIPPQAEAGQAELLFVFPDGTLASLAKFEMLPLAESVPFISPDGGYVIYGAKTSDGSTTLHLMDSSGATRPYGEPGKNVRALGWLPDSQRFIYSLDDPPRSFIGKVDGSPANNEIKFPRTTRWIDPQHFLAIQEGNLFLGDVNGGRTLLDRGVSDFDYVF
jgi:hypothetical protein